MNDSEDPGLESLYRRSRIEEPSVELDQSILKQAKRQTSRRKQRRLIPFASAALILIGLSLVVQVIELEKPVNTTLDESTALDPTTAVIKEAEAPVQVAPTLNTQDMRSSSAPESVSRPAPRPAPASDTGGYSAPLIHQEHLPNPARARQKTRAMAIDAEMTSSRTAPHDENLEATPVERELRRIRKLLSQGQVTQARHALDALLAAHPTLELPPDLHQLRQRP